MLEQHEQAETLDDLTELDVFTRCLDAHQIADEQREELLHSYYQVLDDLRGEDGMAESGDQLL